MFTYFLSICISHLLYLTLHISSDSSFPKPLSPKEEKECLELIRSGDRKAHNKLVSHNLRLVAHVVKRYYNCGMDQDELISIGTIGLIKGINSFKEQKNTRLATYASRCIENEILMALRSLKKSAQDVYINEPIDYDSEGNALTLLDILSDDTDLVDITDIKIKSEKLSTALKTLTKREKYIIIKRYGLDGKEEMTQNQLAERLDISRSYVSRLEKAALKKLKSEL